MMTKQTELILNLMKQGKTATQIAQELGITHQQLYVKLTNLQNKGFLFKKNYFSNGEIGYRASHDINQFLQNKAGCILFTKHEEESVKTLIISDLHLGNELERLDLLDRAFNFCVKNNIHTIFICGDFIDGTFTKGKQKISNIYSQIEYFIKKYPHDDSIFTFGVGGDHDYSAIKNSMQDFNTIVNNYRHDIKIPNYNNVLVNIKNSGIILHHDMLKGYYMNSAIAPIIFNGHFHRYIVKKRDSNFFVDVPSLSDINESIPSAIFATFNFQNGYINSINLKQVVFSDKDYIMSENVISIPNNFEVKSINYENYDIIQSTKSVENDTFEKEKLLYSKESEPATLNVSSTDIVGEISKEIEEEVIIEEKNQNEEEELTLKRTPHIVSQIDKFNKRYRL